MSGLKVEFVDNSALQYQSSAALIKVKSLSKTQGKLYLGDRNSVSYVQLKHRNCQIVVCCSREMFAFSKEPHITYLKADPSDEENNHLEETFSFIQKHLAHGRNVVVSCESGGNKSAVVLLYFLMKSSSLSLAESYKALQQCRELKIAPRLLSKVVTEELKLNGRASISVQGRDITFLEPSGEISSSRIVSPQRKKMQSGSSGPSTVMVLGAVGGFFFVVFGAIYFVTGKI